MIARAGVRPLVLALLAAVVVACGGAVAPTAAPTDAPTPTPSPAPTPSPTPDALDAFRAALAEPGFEASADLVGTIDVGPAFDVTGRLEVLGGELHVTIVTDFGASTQTTEQLVIDDTTYVRQGEPIRWQLVRELTGPRRPTPFPEAAAELDLVRTGDTWSADGEGARTLLESLGLVDPGFDVTDIALAIDLDTTGRLVAMEAAFTSEIAGSTNLAAWDVAFTFDARPNAGPFEAPEPVWIAYDPGRVYTVWHPEGWEPDVDADDDFTDFYTAPEGRSYVAVYCLQGSSMTLDEWTADGREFYAKAWGADPEPSEDGLLGGEPAKVYAWEAAIVEGEETFVVNVAAVRDGVACDLQWFSEMGNEEADALLFTGFVASFTFAD